MNKIIILALISMYNFQLTQEDLSTKALEDSINADIRAKNQAAKDQYAQDMAAFMDDFERRVEDNVGNTVSFAVGDSFNIVINENCEFEAPEQPIPPITAPEVECGTAKVEAQLMAQAVAKLSGDAPKDPLAIMNALALCEVISTETTTIRTNIYEMCLGDEFKEFYTLYFNQLRERLALKGFSWVEGTNGAEGKFVKVENDVVQVQTAETTVRPALAPLPVRA
jgi:hypothetical protein